MTLLLTMWILSWGAGGGDTAAFSPSGDWLQYAAPAEAGFSAEALDEAYAMAAKGNTAAFMLVYRGKVLAAWGRVDSRYKCHSVRKSFYSALFGIYRAEGKIDLNKTLAELGVNDIHGLNEIERTATLRHLISARSGVYHPAAKEPADMKRNRPKRGVAEPGTRFFYNNWDFNTSSAILEREIGVELFEAFGARLADPLGFQDFRPRDGFHEIDRSASQFPAHAFRMTARDMARFGQLYLQNGVWKGQRILTEAWIRESTEPISRLSNMSYGYMWWVLEKGAFEPFPELSAYLASGVGGQEILVCEDADMVMVHRGDTDHNRHSGTGEALRLFFKILAGKTDEPVAKPRLVPMKARPLPGRLPAIADREFITVSAETLQRFAGDYRMPNDVVVTIRPLPDRLVAAHPHLGETDMFPLSPTRFAAGAANIEIAFALNEAGAIAGGDLNLYGQKLWCAKVE